MVTYAQDKGFVIKSNLKSFPTDEITIKRSPKDNLQEFKTNPATKKKKKKQNTVFQLGGFVSLSFSFRNLSLLAFLFH